MKNLSNRGAASLAVTLIGSLLGIGLLTTTFFNNGGSKGNLLAQVSSPPSFKVLSPNGGETWEIGKTYDIYWSTGGDSFAPFGVYLLAFDEFGGTYIADTIVPNLTLNNVHATYDLTSASVRWNVPSTVKSGKYLIRVVAYPEDKVKSYGDSSDTPFAIIAPPYVNPFRILSPTAGEKLTAGQSYNVRWSGVEAGINDYSVYLMGGPNGLTSGIYLGPAQESDKDIKSVSVVIPYNVSSGTDYKIRFTGKAGAGGDSAEFDIVAATPELSVTINEPNEKTTWQMGTTQQIKWIGKEPGIDFVSIHLWRDWKGGPVEVRDISYGSSVPISQINYSWTIPTNLEAGSGYFIQLRGKAIDWESGRFSLTAPPIKPSIKVLSPNGGEVINPNATQTYDIKWASVGLPEKVRVLLYKGNQYVEGKSAIGSLYYLPGYSVPVLDITTGSDIGHFTWMVPSNLPAGDDYRIGIQLQDNYGQVYDFDQSDAPFTIVAATNLYPFTVTFPSAGSILKQGQTYKLLWSGNDPGVTRYSVYLVGGSLGAVGSRYLGEVDTSSQDWFSWTVPLDVAPDSGYQIQFGAKAAGDNSDSFTIVAPTIQPPPPPTLICDATAKAILDSVGGCGQLDSSRYPNVYKACCQLVTKETLLQMLENALADGRIDEAEKANLLRALDNYLSRK